MKKLFTILLMMPLFWACSSDSEDIPQPSNKEYIISLGFTGEITEITEYPLSRTTNSDLYGIQVYATDNTTAGYTPYAYGLFNNTDGITIKLLEGYRYKFISTMVVNGVNRISHDTSNRYASPFNYSRGYTTLITNSFTYSDKIQLKDLNKGASSINNTLAIYEHPNLDRYYGEYINFIPSKSKTLSIDMKRMSFGLKVIADQLTEGKLIISIAGAPDIEIEHPKTSVEEIFTFSSVSIRPNENFFSENIGLNIKWQDKGGLTSIIASGSITFKRNVLTKIVFKIGIGAINNEISITKETEEFIREEEIILE